MTVAGHRHERIAEEIRQEVGAMLTGELKDPRLGFVTGAIGAPVTGFVADRVGLQLALAMQIIVVLVTIPIALLLPSESSLGARREVAPAIAATGQ